MESEPEPSGETSSVRSQINNQVNNSGSPKILLALAASLGVLVFGTGAAPPLCDRQMKRSSKRKYWQWKGKMQGKPPMSICYFDRQLQEFADFAAGHHRKLARQYNAASEFRRCQHLYN